MDGDATASSEARLSWRRRSASSEATRTASIILLSETCRSREKPRQDEVGNYLSERDLLASLTFRIGRKLGVKVSNPAPYIDEYTEKWYNCGFEESSLSDIALFCLRTDRNGFDGMHELVKQLFSAGVVSKDSVSEYLGVKNGELKLFTRIQGFCGSLKKSAANLSLIETWHSWNLSDEMILEAAKRSAGSGNPYPLHEQDSYPTGSTFGRYRAAGADIPEQALRGGEAELRTSAVSGGGQSARADRERHYALLRETRAVRGGQIRRKGECEFRVSRKSPTELGADGDRAGEGGGVRAGRRCPPC